MNGPSRGALSRARHLAWSHTFRIAKTYLQQRHPWFYWLQRGLGRRVVHVQDRRTRLRFQCLAGAEMMLPEVFFSRVYDIPLAPLRPGDLVVDVGANHGFATCHFARQGARVLSFEPDSEVFDLLRRNVKRNDLERLVRTEPLAIMGSSGPVRLYSSRLDGGATTTTSLAYLATRPDEHSRTATTVNALSLADALQGDHDDRIRLLKLDCEGNELEILRSIPMPLLERIDSIALEFHREVANPSELFALVFGWNLDFSISKVSQLYDNFHLVRRRVIEEWGRGL